MQHDIPPILLHVSPEPAKQDVVVFLQFEAAVREDQADFWLSLILQLQVVTNCGGFCGMGLPPTASTMSAIEGSLVAPDAIQARFSVGHVDSGYWKVLIHLLAAAHIYNARLLAVDIRSMQADIYGALSAQQALATPYPRAPSSLPFTVVRSERVFNNRAITVRVRLADAAGKEDQERLIAAILAWDELLLGGFPEPGEHPVTNACDATQAYFTDPCTLEHPMPNYLGADEAFDVLLCMFWSFHESCARVGSVMIE